MSQFKEPLWVGIDIDAEWEAYRREEQDRIRAARSAGSSRRDTSSGRRQVSLSLLAGEVTPAAQAQLGA